MDTYKPPYTITSKMLSYVARISEELTKIEYTPDLGMTPKLRKKNRVKTLVGTLEIEGNHLGEEKITAILDGKRVLGTIEEVLEVEGAINAYRVLDDYKYNKLEDLLKAHAILMKGVLKTPGSFRHVNVGVGGKSGVSHVAPPPSQVPNLMNDLFKWLQCSDEHLLIKSCVFHYEFEFIHPFSDGNGRIGRLWQSVILYQWKKIFNAIPTESIIRDHQEQYYQALEDSGALGESTPFIEFMLEIILISLESSVKNSDKSSEKTEDKILNYLQANPHGTIKEITMHLGITSRAVEKQLASLKRDHRLQRTGSARKGEWIVLIQE
jgi:Fic family protein